MLSQVIRPAVIFMVVMTVLTGVIYPLLITGIAQVAFPNRADTSNLLFPGASVSLLTPNRFRCLRELRVHGTKPI